MILGKGLAPVQSPSQPQANKGGVNKRWDVRRGRGAGLLGAHGSRAVRMVRRRTALDRSLRSRNCNCRYHVPAKPLGPTGPFLVATAVATGHGSSASGVGPGPCPADL